LPEETGLITRMFLGLSWFWFFEVIDSFIKVFEDVLGQKIGWKWVLRQKKNEVIFFRWPLVAEFCKSIRRVIRWLFFFCKKRDEWHVVCSYKNILRNKDMPRLTGWAESLMRLSSFWVFFFAILYLS
jgi:hypothetical protein